MRVRADQDFHTYVGGTPLRVAAGTIWTGGAARAMLATRCPVTDLDAEVPPDESIGPGDDGTGDSQDGPGEGTTGDDGTAADEATAETADAEPVASAEAAVVEAADEQAAAPAETADGVPDGNVSDVLDWVDGDADRARQALEAERGRERPRAGLTKQLTQMAE